MNSECMYSLFVKSTFNYFLSHYLYNLAVDRLQTHCRIFCWRKTLNNQQYKAVVRWSCKSSKWPQMPASKTSSCNTQILHICSICTAEAMSQQDAEANFRVWPTPKNKTCIMFVVQHPWLLSLLYFCN